MKREIIAYEHEWSNPKWVTYGPMGKRLEVTWWQTPPTKQFKRIKITIEELDEQKSIVSTRRKR